ncbi:MAG: c-type cytochrome [Acidimicrobiia bacterium]|nr:c-type cytochrome [Acidimicrobiia bacterium]
MIVANTLMTVTVGIVVVLLIVALLVFTGVMLDRRAKTPVPANLKPFVEDDVLETTRLERMLQAAVVTVLFLGVLMAVIFALEPTRQADAYEELNEKAVARGAIVYGPAEEIIDGEPHAIAGAFACQSCHGPAGEGGAAAYTITTETGEQQQVGWTAPALNDVLLRYSEDEVRTIITYGRQGTPMPAWGEAGGGAMSKQQIEDTIAFLESIQLTEEEAKAQNAEVGLVAGSYTNGELSDDAEYDGAALFDKFCARCHTIGFSYNQPEAPGSGGFGPSLRGGASLEQFPKIEDQITFVTDGSEWQVAYGVRGQGTGRMPGFGLMLLPEQIEAIVRYERSLTGGFEGTIPADDTRADEPQSDVTPAEEQPQETPNVEE